MSDICPWSRPAHQTTFNELCALIGWGPTQTASSHVGLLSTPARRYEKTFDELVMESFSPRNMLQRWLSMSSFHSTFSDQKNVRANVWATPMSLDPKYHSNHSFANLGRGKV
jgi:hypothetical protein